MKISLFFVLFLFAVGFTKATEKLVTSPDGNLVVSVSAENGVPTYSVTLNGKQFLQQSPLGLKTNIGDFTQGLSRLTNPTSCPTSNKAKFITKQTKGYFRF